MIVVNNLSFYDYDHCHNKTNYCTEFSILDASFNDVSCVAVENHNDLITVLLRYTIKYLSRMSQIIERPTFEVLRREGIKKCVIAACMRDIPVVDYCSNFDI